MTPYILAPEALQDLQELWDYIAAENLDAADRLASHGGATQHGHWVNALCRTHKHWAACRRFAVQPRAALHLICISDFRPLLVRGA